LDSLDADTPAAAATARFSEADARIVGREVTLRCDESGKYVGAVQHSDGVAAVAGNVAYLAPDRCLDLYRLALMDEGRGGRGNDRVRALQSAVELGQRLGLTEETGRQMVRQQLVENSLHRGSNREYLVPPECCGGDPFDLNPSTSRIPYGR
jgi:hypothetical protein